MGKNGFALEMKSQELETAKVVAIPVPWGMTGYGFDGSDKNAAVSILEAFSNFNAYDPRFGDEADFALIDSPVSGEHVYGKAEAYLNWTGNGRNPDSLKVEMMKHLEDVDIQSHKMVKSVRKASTEILALEKIPCVIGGDHSTALGLMQALTAKYQEFSILQLDAHMDLKDPGLNFEFSHSSVMHHAAKLEQAKKFFQVGVRDFSKEEYARASKERKRFFMYTARSISRGIYGSGNDWMEVVEQILRKIDECVYISFDIDVLEPYLCPNAARQVPGGLNFEQVFFLIEALVEYGIKIIGFDLSEVATEPADVLVGARALQRLSANTSYSWH